MEFADNRGKELIEQLIGMTQNIEHHLKDGNFDNIMVLAHEVRVICRNLVPHLHNEKYRKINAAIVDDVDDLIYAKLTNNARPEHLQDFLKRANEVMANDEL